MISLFAAHRTNRGVSRRDLPRLSSLGLLGFSLPSGTQGARHADKLAVAFVADEFAARATALVPTSKTCRSLRTMTRARFSMTSVSPQKPKSYDQLNRPHRISLGTPVTALF